MTTLDVERPQVHPTGPVRSHKRRAAARHDEVRAGWLFSAPFLIAYLLFVVGPVVIGLVMSLFNTATVRNGLGDWVGLSNYREVLGDADFWSSVWHSALFALISTPLLVVLPLVIAVLASRLQHGRTFYRLAYFAPYVVPSAAVVLIFAWMYAPQIGVMTRIFGWFGIDAPNFLGDTTWAWFAVVLMTLWWTFGFNFILYTAALQNVPSELYEAAAMDGATPRQQIWAVTVPLLRPTVSLVLILQLLASLKVFDQIYLLLQGGPDYSTRPAIEYIYDTGFTDYRGGYAAAATMVYFLMLVVIAIGWALVRRRFTDRTEAAR